MVRIKSSQKVFTETEVAKLTGICSEHLRSLVSAKNLGKLVHAAQALGTETQERLFSNSDLMILAVLHPRCEH